MRDKNRIQPFLDELGKQWSKVPDWRFGQLMANILSTCDRDPFFYEDDEMISLIKGYFEGGESN